MVKPVVRHPESSKEVQGEVLIPGTELRVSDVFAGPTGEWEHSPHAEGRLVASNGTLWVRPAENP